MSALNGANYAKAYVNVPSDRPNVGEYGGSLKILLDSSAVGIAADTINIGKLPINAKVLSVSSIGLGGAGAAVNVAPMDLMAAEFTVIATIGAAPSLPISVWVEYVVV